MAAIYVRPSFSYMNKPGPTANEPAWSKWLAHEWGGVPEHRTFDGSRVDILTETHAWEVEWIKKWPEAIGQALYLSLIHI